MDKLSNPEQLQKICMAQGIIYLGLFGSYARGDNNKNSDVDLLVKFGKNISLFDLARAQNQFSDLFNLPVDLVVETTLKPRILPYVEKDLVTILTKDFTDLHPEFPTREAVTMRNKLVHDYSFIDSNILWDTITRDIPDLLTIPKGLVEHSS